MKRFAHSLAFLLVSICCSPAAFSQQIEARFSPHGGIASAIRRQMDTATTSIYCQAYKFTSPQILAGFIEARRRGVPCFIILDSTNIKQDYQTALALRSIGCIVKVDSQEKINHNKTIIIDEKIVITGSYNFTAAAESLNAETILFIEYAPITATFIEDFRKHALHSKPLTPLSAPAATFTNPRHRPR